MFDSKLPLTLLLPALLMMVSCRGQISDRPPIHPQQNMYFQERFNAQQENPFFEDGRSMRMPVEGTVARGLLREDSALHLGRDENGEFVDEIPIEISRDFLYRGQDRYDIYCSVCHGGTGDGQGIIMTGQYGYAPAPTFHQDRVREQPAGEIYSAIYDGIRTMPSYRHQVPLEDRWAIVAYIRALQESQYQNEEQMQHYDVDLASLLQAHEEERLAAEAAAPDPEDVADEVISADRGRALYTQNGCQACHSTDGSPGIGPTLQGIYGTERSYEDGSTVMADEEHLFQQIVNPGALISEGYDPFMQPFSHLSDDDVYSLVEFIKTLSDN